MKLSERQRAILAYIQRYLEQEGMPPTMREIGRAVGLSSTASLAYQLRVLEEKGALRRIPGKKRTWQVTSARPARSIPLLGRIAAGTPILAQENREDELLIDPQVFGCEDCFALRVQGDSMIEVHILPGDVAIIRPQEEAEDGQIVAVVVDGVEPEATLKVLRRRNETLELRAANSRYPSLIFHGEGRARLRILGRLAGVIRRS